MMKKWSRFWLALVLSASTMTVELPAQAAQVCKVTDPTGTPLNVRNQPNGRVINTLKNGREVKIEALTDDTKGRSWAKVGGNDKGKYRIWGWVLREFISCYES